MAPKKKAVPKTEVKKLELYEDKAKVQSPRSKMASERALSQYVNNLVKKVEKQYGNRKSEAFADAANQIIETSEGNKNEDRRLMNRVANRLGIEESRYGYKFGGDVPERKNKPNTSGFNQGKEKRPTIKIKPPKKSIKA
jgi:hypothetical protein